MKRRAKIHWIVLAGIVGVAVIAILVMLSGDSATSAGMRFMSALAKGDAQQLTELSYHPNKSDAEMLEDWKFTTENGKHYMFKWKVLGEQKQDANQTTVRIQVYRNYSPGSYEENFGLTMVKREGKWKVSVKELARAMYPGLPR